MSVLVSGLLSALLCGPGPTSAPLPQDPFSTADPDLVVDLEAKESRPGRVSAATHGKIRGTIMAFGRSDPLPGARVVLLDPDLDDAAPEVTETDGEGRFELWLGPGSHRLVLRADGYQDREVSAEIEIGKVHEFVYRLDEDPTGNPYRTVVEGAREVAVSKTTLRDEEIHSVPGSRGDPFAVIKSLPGTVQLAGFLPYVVVRGAAPGNTGYYLDGIRVPLLFHVAAGPSVIHPYFIDEVDFYPSGAPVRLGRFASGIVEGRTKAAAKDRVHGDVDLQLTSAGALLDIPFDRARDLDCLRQAREASGTAGAGKRRTKPRCRTGTARGSLTVGGRYSYTGLVLSLIPALNIKLRFWDYQARLDHRLGPSAEYRLFVFGAYDEIGPRTGERDRIDPETGEPQLDPVTGAPVTEPDPDPDPFLAFDFHRVDNRITQRLRKGGEALYMLALGLDRSGLGPLKTSEWRIMPRINLRLPVGARTEIGLGLDQELQIFRVEEAGIDDVAGDTPVETLGQLLGNRFVSITGLWFDLRWQGPRFEVRPGVRADFFTQVGPSPFLPQARSQTQAFGVDPRLLLREQVGDKVVLRQSIGVYHQPPDSPIPIPGIESLGFDRGLQRNIQGSVGYELDLFGIASLTQDVYLGRLDNLQDYELSADNEDPGFEQEDVIINVKGWTYGLETMLRLAPRRRVYGWLAYTLSRSIRTFPIGGTVPSSWDQTHIVNLVLGYKVGLKWRFAGRMHFHTGRPFTSLTAADVDPLDPTGEPSPLIAARNHRNDSRIPPFFQFDVRIERFWRFKRWQLSAFLDVANANFAREIFQCQSRGSTLAGCDSPQGFRYVLPSLGLRGVF